MSLAADHGITTASTVAIFPSTSPRLSEGAVQSEGDHPLVVAREKAEAAYLAARGQPASVLVPLWEAWSAAQKACINNKPQLKGSAKEIPHPLGKQREGAGTNTTPKPGGQGCSPAALARMCYEVERGTKNWKMGAWKESRLMASLSHGRTWEENFKAGEKRIMDMRLNKTKTKLLKHAEKEESSRGSASSSAMAAPAAEEEEEEA